MLKMEVKELRNTRTKEHARDAAVASHPRAYETGITCSGMDLGLPKAENLTSNIRMQYTKIVAFLILKSPQNKMLGSSLQNISPR